MLYTKDLLNGVNYLDIQENRIIHSTFDKTYGIRIIECDTETRKLVLKKKINNKSRCTITERIIIDENCQVPMDNNGMIWRGNCLDGKPFGYGTIQNAKGVIIYKGYYGFGNKICYGESFTDEGCLEYKGNYYEGMKHGVGELYNRDGSILYKGNWLENQNEMDIKEGTFHSLVEELKIVDPEFNKEKINIHDLPFLKRLTSEEYSLEKAKHVFIHNCPQLQSITFGYHTGCFEDEEYCENDNTVLQIRDCVSLETIILGECAFTILNYFELKSNLRTP